MADEQNPNTNDPSTPTAPAAPSTPPAPAPDIQAQIEAAKREAYNAGAAATRRAFEEKFKAAGSKPEPQPTTPTPVPPAASVTEQFQRLRAFERAAARLDLPDAARDVLEADFNAANPADPSDWVARRAEAFGWKRLGGATPTPTATQPAATTAAPASAQPSPPMPASSPPGRVVTADTPILQLSPSDRAARVKQVGVFAFKQQLMRELADSGQRFRMR